MTYAEKILAFNKSLNIRIKLPDGISVLNPFQGSQAETVWPIVTDFYQKFYNNTTPKHLVLGINPGRLGAGSTGLPFTDTKRLNADCGIAFSAFKLHEPSSVFVYNVIQAMGGPEAFYTHFYIGSVCPLGFVKPGKNSPVNVNYYDDKNLQTALTPFICESINKQLDFGLSREKIFVLGTGKNFAFLNALNKTQNFAKQIVPLEHPRYVMQYKAKQKQAYIEKFVQQLGSVL